MFRPSAYSRWRWELAQIPRALAATFRQQVRKLDTEVATSNVRSMDQYYSMILGPRRFNLQLLSIFALAALALARAGIYGVISYSVNQQALEIGIRMAIGAQRSDVLRMVIREAMTPVMAGLALGLLSVFALTRALASLLFAVSASDPGTLAWVTLLFCGVSFAAILVPARRAAKIDSLALVRTDQMRRSDNQIFGIENPAFFNNTVHNCRTRSIVVHPHASLAPRTDLARSSCSRRFARTANTNHEFQSEPHRS